MDSVPDYGKLAPAKGSVVNNLTLTLVAGQLQVRPHFRSISILMLQQQTR